MDNLVEAGYIVKSHGVRGDLRIRFHDEIALADELPGAFFVHIRGEYLPYFTTSLSFVSETDALVHFEGLEDRETARTLKGCRLYLENQYIEKAAGAAGSVAADLVGYTVIDREIGLIGEVEAVETYPQQEMLVVWYDDRQILIPMRPELVPERHDREKKIITDLPDGFLDL